MTEQGQRRTQQVDDEGNHEADQPAPVQAPALVRPVTGDAEVDRVLRELDGAPTGDGDVQLEALVQAHRHLQARLTGTAGVHPSDPPGQARPGPR